MRTRRDALGTAGGRSLVPPLRRDRVAGLAAVVLPVAVASVLLPLRGRVPNTDVALVLVLVVVGVAANGDRLSAWVAAVSTPIWFDVFWTQPYGRLSVSARPDVETATLLLLVGLAVSEIAIWGRHQHEALGREAGFREGVLAAAEAAATGDSPSIVIERISEQLVRVLDLASCRFDYGTGLDHPRLEHDGSVVRGRQRIDVDSDGFPAGRATEVLVESGGQFRGRFLLTPRPGARPALAERLVAVTLADQAGAALAGYRIRHR